MTNRDQQAIEAQRLLDEPALKRILSAMEADAIEEILACAPSDDAKRLASTERLRVIRDIPQALRRSATPRKEPQGVPAV